MKRKIKNKLNLNIIFIILACLSFFGVFVYTYDQVIREEMFGATIEGEYWFNLSDSNRDTYVNSNDYQKYVNKFFKYNNEDTNYEECLKNETCSENIKSDSFLISKDLYDAYKWDLKQIFIRFSILLLIFICLLLLLYFKKFIMGIVFTINGFILAYFVIFETYLFDLGTYDCKGYIMLIPFILLEIEFIINYIVDKKSSKRMIKDEK